jgi:chemotaxis protein CheD
MARCAVLEIDRQKMVATGQIVAATAPAKLIAVLGSCVAVTLYDPRRRLGAMGHVVLPESSGPAAGPAKFADRAVPNMIAGLERRGAGRAGLVAKMAGGACVFGDSGPLPIGPANIEAVRRALAAVGLSPAAEDTGGTKGRRVVFDLARGTLTVEIAGLPDKVL